MNLFVVILVSLLVLTLKTPSAFAIEEQIYPSSPEAVVEAFVKAEFDGSANEVVGDVNKRFKYVTWEDYPGADCFVIINGFEINKLSEDNLTASIATQYNVLGKLCGYDLLELLQQNETVIFGLIKVGNLWKIDYPDPSPYISPSTALTIVNHQLSLTDNLNCNNKKALPDKTKCRQF